MNQVFPVKECEACGKVCESMDTVCPRCRRYGTLRDRFQCVQCRRLSDDDTCRKCSASTEIRESAPIRPTSFPQMESAGHSIPDVSDPHAVPPWVASAVGGTIFGGVAGAVASFFLDANPLIGGLIGVLPGAVLGGLMGRSPSIRR